MNLVKEIVQLLGGEIRAESKLGKGSSLHIQLPLSK
jgi:signal transduction histidine kinase